MAKTATAAMQRNDWPHGTSEMAGRIRDHDWSATPLGPMERWPQSLCTLVDLMLSSPDPTFIAWGSQLTLLYNDDSVPILGEKHPEALGRPIAEGFSEIWPDYQPIVAATLAGEAQCDGSRQVPVAGGSAPAARWFTFSWVPARDETGNVAGIYGTATETTEKMLTEQALRESEERFRRMVNIEGVGVFLFGPDGTLREADDFFLRMTGYTRAAVESGSLAWKAMTPPEYVEASRLQLEQVGQ